MLYPSAIDYVRFSDTQVSLFAQHAKSECGGNPWWREDLDEAARDLIIGCFAQTWACPSAIINELKLIAKNPDRFFKRITRGAGDHRDAFVDSVDTSLRHGTGWTDNQLLDAANRRDEFLSGVEKEIAFLGRIEAQRKAILEKAGRKRWSNPDVAMATFIDRLGFIYQDAFFRGANDGLTVPFGGGNAGGPFISFAKSIFVEIEKNLSDAVRDGAPSLPVLLKRMAQESDSGLWMRFSRSDYYTLVKGDGKLSVLPGDGNLI